MSELSRPGADEMAAYFQKYVDLVPDGDIVDTLSRQLGGTLGLLQDVTPELETYRYAPGKWSIREVVGHLSDAERVFAYRALRFGRGDTTPLPGFDENEFMKRARLDDRSYASLVDEFAAVRHATVALFDGFFPDEWTRHGSASGKDVSVRALAWIVAGHELHHVDVLKTRYL